MEWVQFIIFFLGVFGLFIWNRTEARTDNRHLEARLDSHRNLIESIKEDGIKWREEMIALRKEAMQESKDFHNRLYSLELMYRRNDVQKH
jgi:HAMP domain-containing protein